MHMDEDENFKKTVRFSHNETLMSSKHRSNREVMIVYRFTYTEMKEN